MYCSLWFTSVHEEPDNESLLAAETSEALPFFNCPLCCSWLWLFSVLLSVGIFFDKNFTTVPFPNDSCFRFAANSRSSFSSASVIPLQYLLNKMVIVHCQWAYSNAYIKLEGIVIDIKLTWAHCHVVVVGIKAVEFFSSLRLN